MNPAFPADPTNARPGSPEKLAILAARARHRQPLFHPQDFTWPESTLIGWLKKPSPFRAALLNRL
jgi:hypothetical protein